MTKVIIQRNPDDPIALRVSIGGTESIGYYCWFRGDQQAVCDMLRLVLDALEHAPPMKVQPDEPPCENN
jgi:hypothetical protein